MYGLTIRDHIMISHSFKGEVFGPAQNNHGATLVIDVTFYAEELTDDDIVIDIGLAGGILKEVISPYNYQNLDEFNEFAGRNTSIDFLSGFFFRKVVQKLQDNGIADNISAVKVEISESHIAKAFYRADI